MNITLPKKYFMHQWFNLKKIIWGCGYLGYGYLEVGYLGYGYLGCGYFGCGYLDVDIWMWISRMPPCQSVKVDCQTSEAPVRAAKHTNTGKTIDPGSLMLARHKCFRAITI